MAKLICESCGSSFPSERVKNMDSCPVCGEKLWGDKSSDNEALSFDEGIELGEDDSFDEDKIDFWWYSIREPGEVWEGITFEDGTVSTNCAKCGNFSGGTPYPIARTKDYLLIIEGFNSPMLASLQTFP